MISITTETLIAFLLFNTVRPFHCRLEIPLFISGLYSPTFKLSMVLRDNEVYQVGLIHEASGVVKIF
jgi:hypothetical protein